MHISAKFVEREMELCNFQFAKHSSQFLMPSVSHSRNDFVTIFFRDMLIHISETRNAFAHIVAKYIIFAIKFPVVCVLRWAEVEARSPTCFNFVQHYCIVTATLSSLSRTHHNKRISSENRQPLDSKHTEHNRNTGSNESTTMQLNEFFRQPQQ